MKSTTSRSHLVTLVVYSDDILLIKVDANEFPYVKNNQ